LHQVGDLFELNVKLRCQKVKASLLVLHWAHTTQQLHFIILSWRWWRQSSYLSHWCVSS